MRLLLCLGLVVAMVCPATAVVYAPGTEEPEPPTFEVVTPAELHKLQVQAAVERIAVLVDSISKGKCRCLIGSAVSAEPKVGLVVRAVDWGDEPSITVYPASVPESLQLPDIGWGRVLGAVNLLVPANPPGGKEKAEAGVYLLVYLPDMVETLPVYREGENCGRVALVSVSVDDKGKTCLKEALTVPASRIKPDVLDFKGDGPALSVWFPGKDDVSDQNPAWRAHVRVTFGEYLPAVSSFRAKEFFTYSFALDLEIFMV